MKPLTMTAEMARACWDGRKPLTRRPVKPQPPKRFSVGWVEDDHAMFSESVAGDFPMWGKYIECPYGKPGDLVPILEPHYRLLADNRGVAYAADNVPLSDGERVAGFTPLRQPKEMPIWASRMTAKITSVSVERLQDISEDEAEAEGVTPIAGQPDPPGAHRVAFKDLWDSIYGDTGYAWAANPWVWRIGHETIRKNIKDVEAAA